MRGVIFEGRKTYPTYGGFFDDLSSSISSSFSNLADDLISQTKTTAVQTIAPIVTAVAPATSNEPTARALSTTQTQMNAIINKYGASNYTRARQAGLVVAGYNIPVNGVFSQDTKAAFIDLISNFFNLGQMAQEAGKSALSYYDNNLTEADTTMYAYLAYVNNMSLRGEIDREELINEYADDLYRLTEIAKDIEMNNLSSVNYGKESVNTQINDSDSFELSDLLPLALFFLK